MKPRSENIGEVTFLSEQIAAARELSSCCIGTEAHLEASAHPRQPSLASRFGNPAGDLWAKFQRLILTS